MHLHTQRHRFTPRASTRGVVRGFAPHRPPGSC
jgi:hypothetical protein